MREFLKIFRRRLDLSFSQNILGAEEKCMQSLLKNFTHAKKIFKVSYFCQEKGKVMLEDLYAFLYAFLYNVNSYFRSITKII